MFSVLRLLMLLIAVLTAASPVSLSSRARIEAGKYVEVQCRGPGKFIRTHTKKQQEYAVDELKRWANAAKWQKPRTGDGNIFPHKYNTRVPHLSPAVDERLNLMPQCNTGQHGKTWLLYPMMEDGKEFRNRTRPGPDRVLVVADGTGDGPYRNYVFCGSIFHPKDMDENDRDGSFDTCSET